MKLEDKNTRELLKILEVYFNKVIRHRDGTKCFTCGNNKGIHAGHFITKRIGQIRFDERNVHIQCFYCNNMLSGNLLLYEKRMIEEYGKELTDEFLELYYNPAYHKWDKDWLIEKIKYYKEKVNECD